MSERDIFFLAMTGIVATTLVVFVVQFVRSRRSRGDGERAATGGKAPGTTTTSTEPLSGGGARPRR
ncbi:hypothetical protein [Microbacterium sp. NIBRBAC000506063]|uniref:hypothetical protein n=1 Tax=Microbacterium sp. NIBRBAC000506063 TaxID=2734618 RepID=UPI001BB4EE48|nr:hypothetical protein [Microbacterium sp. NIBRBAC000506063]QTV80744.1 hypothetical protein KAE78_04580 [Microbacterium sp. NIBRBAC000506063]